MRSSLYTAYQRVSSNLNKALLLFGFILILAGLVGLLFTQGAVRNSQDIRREASVANGPVITVVSQGEGVSQLDDEVGLELNLGLNTNGYQVNRVQYLISLTDGSISRSPEISIVSGMGVILDNSEVQKTADGYLVLISLVSADGGTFSTTQSQDVVSVLLVPESGQVVTAEDQVVLSFDQENSYATITQNGAEYDGLQDIASETFSFPETILALEDTQQPDPGESVPNPVDWETDYVLLAADDLAITAGDQIFSKFSQATLNSDPPEDNGDSYTTLESIWQEDGVEMRMFMYIYRVNDTWTVEEIRTYNGQNPGDWIYYTNPVVQSGPGAGSKISGEVGSVDGYKKSGTITLSANSNGPGLISLSNPWIKAFINEEEVDEVGGPIVKQCNQSCIANSECPSNHMCYQTSSGKFCRLATNPSSTTCAVASDTSQTQTQTQPEVQGCSESCSSNSDCAINLRCYYSECRLATNPSSKSCSVQDNQQLSDLYDQKGGEDEIATDSAQATDSAELTPPPLQDWNQDVIDRTQQVNQASEQSQGMSLMDRIRDFVGQIDQLAVVVIGAGIFILILGLLWALSKRLRSRSTPSEPIKMSDVPTAVPTAPPAEPTAPPAPLASPVMPLAPPMESRPMGVSPMESPPAENPLPTQSPSSSMVERMRQKGVKYKPNEPSGDSDSNIS